MTGRAAQVGAPVGLSGRSSGSPADRLALRDLVESYAVAVDHLDADLFTSLFTPTARLRVYRSGEREPSSTRSGDSLPGVVSALGARYRRTFHVVGTHRNAVDGDTATGETHCIAHHIYLDDAGTPTDLEMLVHYVDAYERGADGTWRFADRRVNVLGTWTHPVDGTGF